MNSDKMPIVCIFGGTGFIGAQIIRKLAADGYQIKVATRIPERAYDLKPCGTVGQIVPVMCDYSEENLNKIINGCDIVINCVGILFEKGQNKFNAVHAELPARMAKICTQMGVQKFIHISALGVDVATSKYAQSKLAGESAVRENFPAATILRPSVVFGAGDGFFNMFARLSVVLPFLPLIGGGITKLQPVYVGDVADAVRAVILSPMAAGKTYELGGADVLTFQQIYETLFSYTHRPRRLINVPFGVASIQGKIMGLLPRPLMTADQVETLKTDNIVSAKALTLYDLGVNPTSLSVILPTYLNRFRPGGRFGDKKTA